MPRVLSSTAGLQMKSCKQSAAQLEEIRGLVLSWLALVQAEEWSQDIFLLWSYFPYEASLEFLIEHQVEVCMFGHGITKGSEHLHPLGSSHTSLAEMDFLSTEVFLLKTKTCKQCSWGLNTPKAFPNANIGFAWLGLSCLSQGKRIFQRDLIFS